MRANIFPSCSPQPPEYANLTGFIYDGLKLKLDSDIWSLPATSGNRPQGASDTCSPNGVPRKGIPDPAETGKFRFIFLEA